MKLKHKLAVLLFKQNCDRVRYNRDNLIPKRIMKAITRTGVKNFGKLASINKMEKTKDNYIWLN